MALVLELVFAVAFTRREVLPCSVIQPAHKLNYAWELHMLLEVLRLA